VRVAILTSGRFHVADLARELSALGVDVLFYSLLPTGRARLRGVPERSVRWLGSTAGPLWLAQRLLGRGGVGRRARGLMAEVLDRTCALRLEPVDALIGMAGMSLHSLRAARRRFGAVTFVERSSRHVLDQVELTAAMPGRAAPSPRWYVRRELAEYAEADFVTVPSRHVEESFVGRGFPASRIFRNALGVSLEEFPVTRAPHGGALRVLMVGAWSRRKACDVLTEAMARLPEHELHHVGPIGDLAFPSAPNMVHHEPVPQPELARFYERSHVLALPSREDGFGMVLSQALASGLAVVASHRTGAPDLAELLGESAPIHLVAPGDVDELERALRGALAAVPPAGAARDPLGASRDELAWRAYAARYLAQLERSLAARRPWRQVP